MKLSQLYTADIHNAGAELQLRDEFGKALNLWLTFVGVDSKIYRDMQKKLERMTILFMRNPENADRMDDETFYAECALSWRGEFEGDDGKPLDFSKESVKELFYGAPYVLNQVKAFIRDRENFTKG